jgi:hypothetical protein
MVAVRQRNAKPVRHHQLSEALPQEAWPAQGVATAVRRDRQRYAAQHHEKRHTLEAQAQQQIRERRRDLQQRHAAAQFVTEPIVVVCRGRGEVLDVAPEVEKDDPDDRDGPQHIDRDKSICRTARLVAPLVYSPPAAGHGRDSTGSASNVQYPMSNHKTRFHTPMSETAYAMLHCEPRLRCALPRMADCRRSARYR